MAHEKAELREQLRTVEEERDALRDELLALATRRARWFSPKGRRLVAALALAEADRDEAQSALRMIAAMAATVPLPRQARAAA